MALLTSKNTAARLTALLRRPAPAVPPASAYTPTDARRKAPHPWRIRWSERAQAYLAFIPADAVIARRIDTSALTHPESAPADWYTVADSAIDSGGFVTVTVAAPPASSTPTDPPTVTVAFGTVATEEDPLLTFIPAAVSGGTAADPARRVTQYVTGAVSLGTGGGGRLIVPGALDIADVDGTLCLVQHWDLFDGSTRTPNVENPDFATQGSLNATVNYAFVLPTADHADDHTAGLIP